MKKLLFTLLLCVLCTGVLMAAPLPCVVINLPVDVSVDHMV